MTYTIFDRTYLTSHGVVVVVVVVVVIVVYSSDRVQTFVNAKI